jgi:pimeloyl-ACP methyl ester carboxylesterase
VRRCFAQAHDGSEVELLAAGPENGNSPPLLFLHGAFAGAWIWAEHFMPFLAAQGVRSFALSFRGHGESAGHERLHCATLGDYVADVRRAISIIGEPPVLVGQYAAADVLLNWASRTFSSGQSCEFRALPGEGRAVKPNR